MVAFLFAGQGAQYIGMGKDLYESFPESKAIFDQADLVFGFPLSRLCFAGPQEELKKTINCQPAILATSIACWEAFKTVTGRKSQVAGYVAGLSLGEYSALVASGALSFEDALYLVRRRGEFMEEAAAKSPGKMLSVIGLDLEAVKTISDTTGTEIANINCPGQTVISGAALSIEKAEALAKERGAKITVKLEVNGAFHSSFMKGASEKLAKELERIKIKPAVIPIVSNVTAKAEIAPEEIKENLVKQVCGSVLWEDSMKFILSKGILNFIELGPGRVLKGLMRRIDPDAQVVSIEKKEDILNLKLNEVA